VPDVAVLIYIQVVLALLIKNSLLLWLKTSEASALGYGFKLAIQNLCPTCDNVMQALQSTTQAINRMNIDSVKQPKVL
jgi:conjugative transfer pilus assembly protein TraH